MDWQRGRRPAADWQSGLSVGRWAVVAVNMKPVWQVKVSVVGGRGAAEPGGRVMCSACVYVCVCVCEWGWQSKLASSRVLILCVFSCLTLLKLLASTHLLRKPKISRFFSSSFFFCCSSLVLAHLIHFEASICAQFTVPSLLKPSLCTYNPSSKKVWASCETECDNWKSLLTCTQLRTVQGKYISCFSSSDFCKYMLILNLMQQHVSNKFSQFKLSLFVNCWIEQLFGTQGCIRMILGCYDRNSIRSFYVFWKKKKQALNSFSIATFLLVKIKILKQWI